MSSSSRTTYGFSSESSHKRYIEQISRLTKDQRKRERDERAAIAETAAAAELSALNAMNVPEDMDTIYRKFRDFVVVKAGEISNAQKDLGSIPRAADVDMFVQTLTEIGELRAKADSSVAELNAFAKSRTPASIDGGCLEDVLVAHINRLKSEVPEETRAERLTRLREEVEIARLEAELRELRAR